MKDRCIRKRRRRSGQDLWRSIMQATAQSQQPFKILFIAGYARSGSTLFMQLLGELPQWLPLGEGMDYLFNERCLARDIPCGCGRAVPQCPFWNKAEEQISPESRRLFSRYLRVRYAPLWISPVKGAKFRQLERQLGGDIRRLFQRIAGNSGARVIVDASKHPLYPYFLARHGGAEVYVLHLVRDVRGCVTSYARPKGYLPRKNLFEVAMGWNLMNLFAEGLRVLGRRRYLRMRCEDFVRDPEGSLRKVVEFAGETIPPLGFIRGRQAVVGAHHLLAGNPDKFKTGILEISPKPVLITGWKMVMAVLLTFPLLLHYKYPFRIKGAAS